ncbi:hypothetical protein DVB73_11290 [Pseudomonas plecoglossicida]|uniref:Uncharacterized protein n=1 Tax=Pseudomonas plecoglossicida TaxID=70775 RepID=A0AAD0QWR1_PSEDL|nr:hypothetical protein DVB73_11290 [Pseudomonas plecoglossicida]
MEGGPMSRPCSPEAACERAFYPETMVRKVVDFHDAGTALRGGVSKIRAFSLSSTQSMMKRTGSIAGKPAPTEISTGLKPCAVPVGAGLPAIGRYSQQRC